MGTTIKLDELSKMLQLPNDKIIIVSEDTYRKYYSKEKSKDKYDVEASVLYLGIFEPLDCPWFGWPYPKFEERVDFIKNQIENQTFIELLTPKTIEDKIFNLFGIIEPNIISLLLVYDEIVKTGYVSAEAINKAITDLIKVVDKEIEYAIKYELPILRHFKEIRHLCDEILSSSSVPKKIINYDRLIQLLHFDPDLFYHKLDSDDYENSKIWYLVNLISRWLDYLRYGSAYKVNQHIISHAFYEFLDDPLA